MNIFGTLLNVASSFLPQAKNFEYLRHAQFVVDSIAIITKIDADMDGKVDGKEKMRAAKAELFLALKNYPELNTKFNLEPEKTEVFLNKLVEALDVVVK